MHPKIEIASREFKAFKGTSEKSGKAYDMAKQEGYLHNGGKYPEKMEVPLLEKDGNGNWIPYPEGFYVPTPDSYQVRDGRLSINNFELRLLAMPAEAKAPLKAAG